MKLNNLMAAYADLWADVLLDKNLYDHFLAVNEDLYYLKQLIALKSAGHHDTVSYDKIAQQLICLKAIIAVKLKREALNKHSE